MPSPSSHLPSQQTGGTILLLIVVLAAACGGALTAFWVYQNYGLQLRIADQPAKITLPSPLPATVQMRQPLNITVDETLTARVPVQHDLDIPIKAELETIVAFNTQTPLKLDVKVKEKIVIDQTLLLDTIIRAKVMGVNMDIPIKGTVPIKTTLPLDLTLPINQPVDLRFTTPVTVSVDENITVPLSASVEANIPLRTNVSIPAQQTLRANVNLPTAAMDIRLNQVDLNIPLHSIQLKQREDNTATGTPAE